MDPGAFKRKSWTGFVLLFLPAVCSVSVLVGAHMYRCYTKRSLEERRLALRVIPGAQQRLQMAKELAQRLQLGGADPASATVVLSVLIDEASVESGFVVDALDVEDAPVSIVDGLQSVAVSVRGTGTLNAVVQFLGMLQRPDRMVLVGEAEVRALRVRGEPEYEAGFTFHYTLVSI